MTIADAKSLDINDVLRRLGYQPTRRTAKDTWYKRPYGIETHASFHVSKDGRAWFDFGTGQGGNIIDLAMLLGPCQEVAQALAYLERLTGPLTNALPPNRQPPIPPTPATAAYTIDRHQSLADPRGVAFLKSRALDPLILSPYLNDVFFSRRQHSTSQPLYGVGLANLAGGFELRAQLEGSHWHKTSLGPKDISVFLGQPAAAWLCFEGLPDFGSFLTLDRPPMGTFNYVVLNGTGMTAKAMAFLATQPVGSLIICSQAGEGAATAKAALLAWAAQQGWQRGDMDHKWQGFGDLNEKLMHQQGLGQITQPVLGRSALRNTPKMDR